MEGKHCLAEELSSFQLQVTKCPTKVDETKEPYFLHIKYKVSAPCFRKLQKH